MYPTRLAGSQLNLFISGVAAHTWRRRERGVHRVRVLVANQPRLMRELVLATIADQPDIEVIGEIADATEILVAVGEIHPDVVIVALSDPDRRPALCAELMERFPQLKIVALAPALNTSMVLWSV